MKLLMIALAVATAAAAAPNARGAQNALAFDAEVTQRTRVPYLLFLPAEYESDQQRRWPFVLYLHGGSARGDDIERLRAMGLPQRLEKDPRFPFVVASPLLPEGEIWSDAGALGALLDRLTSELRIDRERIYVTGHSMGGRGALYAAYRMPERFAAVAALSPYSPITAWSKRLTSVPLWVIHGAQDKQAPVRDSEELIAATVKAGGKPRFTTLPDRDHFILDAYERDDIFQWLLEHRRAAPNASK